MMMMMMMMINAILLLTTKGVSEWVVLSPAQHITDHFGNDSFQAIICTRTDNSNKTRENTSITQNKQTGSSKKQTKNIQQL